MTDKEKEILERAMLLIVKATSDLNAAHLMLYYLKYQECEITKQIAEVAMEMTKPPPESS